MRIFILFFALLANPAYADLVSYKLDSDRSTVVFSYEFGGNPQTGYMPVRAARMLIDLDNVTASSVSVTLAANRARAGFLFATQAMKSTAVLNTNEFPDIQFNSTRITGTLQSAIVTGNLTVRGITRPVTLEAGLYRQTGTDAGDRDNLAILLTGDISRAAFGAVGYPAYVGNIIHLRIIALISK